MFLGACNVPEGPFTFTPDGLCIKFYGLYIFYYNWHTEVRRGYFEGVYTI